MHNRKSRPGVSRAAFETYSTCNLHLLGALHAEDTDLFRGTDGLTTAGTGILAGAAGLLLSGGIVREVQSTGDSQLVSPTLGGTEGFERWGWLGDGVSDLGIIVNQEAPLFGFLFEALVMVGIAPAGVLNAV